MMLGKEAPETRLQRSKRVMNISQEKIRPIQPAEIFNGYVAANVAHALQKIGFFSLLASHDRMTRAEIATHLGCDLARLSALLGVSETLGYLTFDTEERVSLTTSGEMLRDQIGYFTWCIGGYGDFLRHLGDLASDPQLSWQPLRDEGMVALGADQCHRSWMEDILFQVMDELSFSRIADLGCGNAGRLIALATRYSHITGVGIDISSHAIQLAEENVRQHYLENRLQMIHTNVLDTLLSDAHQATLADVEVVSSFMMLHDLYSLPEIWKVLFDRLRSAFPRAKYFLFADTVRTPSLNSLAHLPIFSLGYELLHAYMGVRLPTREVYDEAFTKSGLTIEKCLAFGAPATYLYLLRV
jgi:SAM-dependent methyltransferase